MHFSQLELESEGETNREAKKTLFCRDLALIYSILQYHNVSNCPQYDASRSVNSKIQYLYILVQHSFIVRTILKEHETNFCAKI